MATEVLSCRINGDIKNKITQLGKNINRSKSFIVEQALASYLEQNSWQVEQLHNANEEIKENAFISNEEVNKFLDSW